MVRSNGQKQRDANRFQSSHQKERMNKGKDSEEKLRILLLLLDAKPTLKVGPPPSCD